MGDIKPLASLLGIRGRDDSGGTSPGGVGIGAGTGVAIMGADGTEVTHWSFVGGGPTACATGGIGARPRGCDSDPPFTALPGRCKNEGLAFGPSPDPLDDGSDTLSVKFLILNPGAMIKVGR